MDEKKGGIRKDENNLSLRLKKAFDFSPFPKDAKGILRTCLWLAPLLFLLDLLSKWIVVWTLGNDVGGILVGGKAEVIPNFFYIHLTFNEGMAFGIGDGEAWARGLLAAISFLGAGVILYFWLRHIKKNDLFANILFAMTFAGALGNAIDRAFYWENIVGFNGVVDFFEFYLFGINNAPFAIFNVADALLVVGVILAVILMAVRSIKETRKEEKGEGDGAK